MCFLNVSVYAAGGTFFMLDQLQPDKAALWGGEEPQGSVLACDFYNSSSIATLSDEDVIAVLMDKLLPSAVPGFAVAKASHRQRRLSCLVFRLSKLMFHH